MPLRAIARGPAASYAAVALGSGLGGGLRALVSLAAAGLVASGFPWATLFVNVTGSFAIGLCASLTGPGGRPLVGPRLRLFVMTGVCGGYTTFSAFSLETLHLMQAGHPAGAAAYAGLSTAGSLAAAWLGHRLAGALPNRRRSG